MRKPRCCVCSVYGTPIRGREHWLVLASSYGYDYPLPRFEVVKAMSAEPVYLLRFDDLPADRRATMAAAASQYLLANDYVSVYEACEILELNLQQLWDKIMDDADLPRCEHPGFGMVC